MCIHYHLFNSATKTPLHIWIHTHKHIYMCVPHLWFMTIEEKYGRIHIKLLTCIVFLWGGGKGLWGGRREGKKWWKKRKEKSYTKNYYTLFSRSYCYPYFPFCWPRWSTTFLRNTKHITLKMSAAKALSNWKKLYRLKNR